MKFENGTFIVLYFLNRNQQEWVKATATEAQLWSLNTIVIVRAQFKRGESKNHWMMPENNECL